MPSLWRSHGLQKVLRLWGIFSRVEMHPMWRDRRSDPRESSMAQRRRERKQEREKALSDEMKEAEWS